MAIGSRAGEGLSDHVLASHQHDTCVSVIVLIAGGQQETDQQKQPGGARRLQLKESAHTLQRQRHSRLEPWLLH